MYYEPTMTPPPPKIIFPTAETEPPSTPYPTDLQSPQIIISFEPELTIQITTQKQNNVETPYPATPSIITITVTTTPINIVVLFLGRDLNCEFRFKADDDLGRL